MRRSNEGSAAQQERGNFTPPPRIAAPPAEVSEEAPAGGSTSRLSPRNWRVPTRLNAILLIPVLVGLVMGGFQVKGSIDTWREAQDAEKTALIVRAASEYGQALLNERDLSAQPLLSNKRDSAAVDQVYATTDAAATKFDEAVQGMPKKEGLQRRLQLFKQEEPKLPELRKAAYAEAMDPVKTEEGYVKVQHSLMEFCNELGLGTGNITSYGRTVYAIELAKAAESLQRSIGMHLLVRPSKEGAFGAQVKAFGSYNYLEQIALGEYVSGGTEADSVRLKQVMTAKAAEGAKKLKAAKAQADAAGVPFVAPPSIDGSVFDGMAQQIGLGKSPEELAAKGITPETWMAASTAKFDGYTTVEEELVDKAVTEAANISSSAKTDAIVNAAIVLVALLAAFILAGLVARQMSRSMRQLRTAAFSIAEQRLPMLVDQLSRTEPGRVDTRVQPIPITTRDEIGEVARAFDQVHREAVRLAAEQAMLRGNVNAIFTNLSRRNQSLIEGQLTLITDLENNEADPDQLESLFRLDHLATRMRRNGENLLVLAGEEPGRRWNQPVPLVDVLRAASSEVESYERIELSGVPETEIHGQAVTDLVHLLAELLENATTFSSPQTKVRVTATRLPDSRVMVEIHDKGIGLTAEDFADINHKLANPPTVDAAVSQRMGLFVVGRLADRHGIRVQLRPSGEQAGTTSLVMLPDAITHGGGGELEPIAAQDDFTVSSIIPRQQAFEPLPHQPQMRTAAELGFDDSRYEDPAVDPAQLDPVGRSLMREERRAALEAQTGGERPQFQEDAFQGNAYQEASYAEDTYAQDPQQEQYPQAAYDSSYNTYSGDSGYAEQSDYPSQGGYTEAAYAAAESAQRGYEDQFAAQPHQEEWADQGAYQGAYEPISQAEPESVPSAPAEPQERVGFDRSGPTPNVGREMTDAGLPRRGGQQHWQPTGRGNDQSVAAQQQQPQQELPQQPSPAPQDGNGSDDWRSTNDERWERAEKLREPKAGGVTPSGLPRRVPKANLVEGTAEQTQQGGPQVSRAPEDVRGRLSNLRRGIQRGRNAGSDTSNTYNQER
ncbi:MULTISPECIES: sensor histidine kinase [unclassified Streptomyces]|uniref:sensor histidine kinase n=1 Tax=unclassified Streptomyces TaxID=2593676 RepID=UPI002DD9CBA1|nr:MULTISPECIES: nitrate- and nitrite sensing domain-containing protein [unclassified Streptomyces]WSF84263.1 nitrate- and nitrite sensing domain-containing protein [Streptomyces sp. NBC_01744]WSC47589.1 nitrate- and nitrite sensing domain-containing protein [Streptomyces sp. NBC_01762]WSC53420.1 nitrate- and nitrite sensing domain-containing protein [Streptomyces sp. NBC_01761]WSD27242.1 nitrate- and nitrite sensing domain-containing protein [Streptomyces sp. NBC_01751]WSJ50832.1 nitrate- and